MVLGGGRHQIELIKFAEEKGIEVVLSDYLPESPGHKVASFPNLTSTLDFEANLELAKKFNTIGVITSGTDQPLNIMAQISEELKLPCYLTPDSAALCTNKKKMFSKLQESGCNLPKYTLISLDSIDLQELDKFQYPLIVKPIDSQGQRGISILQDQNDLKKSIQLACSVSRDSQCIVQEYIQGPEITISAWVHEENVNILLITDRVTYNKEEAVGVCFQHIYPSQLDSSLWDSAQQQANYIASAYSLKNGPLYIQCILNNNKIHIVEATCRIGGGHEDQLIKKITGINVYPLLLELATKGKLSSFPKIPSYPIEGKYGIVNFILANEGIFHDSNYEQDLIDGFIERGFINGGLYYQLGHQQTKIVNSLGRIGYFISTSDESKAKLLANSAIIYDRIKVTNSEGQELTFWPAGKFLNQ